MENDGETVMATVQQFCEAIDVSLSIGSDLIGFYKKANTVKKEIGVEVNQVQHSYDLQISPLTDRQTGIAGSLIVLRDITARREAEQG